MRCTSCGGQNSPGVKKCEYCGAEIKPIADAQQSRNESRKLVDISITAVPVAQPAEKWDGVVIKPEHGGIEGRDVSAGLDPYYKDAFNVFESTSPPKLSAKFNWAAFFFGPFWYFYQGLWAKGLLYIVFNVLVSGAPYFWFISWIYGALFGTYDLYLLRKYDKQLW